MAVTQLYDLARMTTATTGTGTITLGSAVDGFLTFAGAGASDGETVSYAITDGDESETGTGTYTASGTTLSRTVLKSTNSDAAISLSGTAQVMITPNSADYNGYLHSDAEDQGPLTGGASVTSKSLTAGSITPDPADRSNQYVTNSGAFTLTAPSADGSYVLLVTNDASAGAITFSGFTVGSNVGDALDTTNTNKFKIYVDRTNSISTYSIQACQ